MEVVSNLNRRLFDGLVYDTKKGDSSFLNLCKSAGSSNNDKIVELLNSIANQDITKFDTVSLTYERDGKVLSLYELSSGEWVFLISWLANICKTNVAIGSCIQHINPSIFDKFLQLNKDNKYLTIFTGDRIELNSYLKYKLEELK